MKKKTKKGVVAPKPPVKVSSSESSDDDSSDESNDVSNTLNCISILFIYFLLCHIFNSKRFIRLRRGPLSNYLACIV